MARNKKNKKLTQSRKVAELEPTGITTSDLPTDEAAQTEISQPCTVASDSPPAVLTPPPEASGEEPGKEVDREAIQESTTACKACGSTRAFAVPLQVTKSEFEGKTITRCWVKCSDCGQIRIERQTA